MNNLLRSPTADQWSRVGVRHHHGINIPLFALRSSTGCGIGEYPDLLPILDWCARIGLDVVQVLPLNDTGPDASPYSAISAFALNPIHLGLLALPRVDKYPDLHRYINDLKELNASQRVSYHQVRSLKEAFLKHYFALEFSQLTPSEGYKKFLNDNRWLRGFALFKTLKTQQNWEPWELWPEELKNPTSQQREVLEKQHLNEIQYHEFVQYLCAQQLQAVKTKASQLHVNLKGDIPILISRESADLWEHRSLFQLNYSAGAPPDMYAEEGQKWGFPIFNWEAMEQDHFRWWLDRLAVASRYYHLYRLDHIVGFFRIWAIPIEKPCKEGFFLPKEKQAWIPQGRKILQMMVKSSSLLPIGEDLGAIPDGVRPCLKELGICGTKVMRWERRWNSPNKEFIPINEYNAESMTTLSTHDSDTLDLWWSKFPDEAKPYASTKGWQYAPQLTKDQRLSLLRDSHQSGSLFHINLLQEYLALFPDFTWPNPEDERINVPGTLSDNNWSYRFRPTIEQIIGNDALAEAIRQVLS